MSATILVIEDTPTNMKLVTMLLRKSGYEVLQAQTAAHGIELARRYLPELILMDMQLPAMDGMTATRILKANAATAGIKVVALTACAIEGDAQRMIDAGCDAYLAKPVRYQTLLDTVQHLLMPRPRFRRPSHDNNEKSPGRR